MRNTLPLVLTALLTHTVYAGSYSNNELDALRLSNQWMNGKSKPRKNRNGRVIFSYGQAQQVIVCKPLHICDIELEQGEVILKKLIGDSHRWEVAPAIVGTPPKITSHILVKPHEAGITTNLVITTDRRIYNLRLRSHSARNYMAKVGFNYETQQSRWDDYYRLVSSKSLGKLTSNSPLTKQSSVGDNLWFDYKITGDAAWRPLRVYNNGRKTFIDMPKSTSVMDAPTLLVVNKNSQKVLVNSRLKENRFIVDQIFQRAILIVGVGENQERVLIDLKGNYFEKLRKAEKIQEVNVVERRNKRRSKRRGNRKSH